MCSFCLEVAHEEMDTSTSTIIGLIGLQTHTKNIVLEYRSDRITHRIREDRNESDLRTQCKCNKCEICFRFWLLFIIIRCYYFRYSYYYRCCSCCYKYVVVIVVVGVSPEIIRYQCDFSDPTHSSGLGRQAALEAIDVLLEQL